MNLDFNDFMNFFYLFESEDIINNAAQRFKQKLTDNMTNGRYDISDPETLSFVFRELFLASMSANLQVLEVYNRFLAARLHEHHE